MFPPLYLEYGIMSVVVHLFSYCVFEINDFVDMPQSDWGRDLPSLPFKSHKTINLTSLDPLGHSEPYLGTNLDFTSQQTRDMVVKTVNVSSQSGNVSGLLLITYT